MLSVPHWAQPPARQVPQRVVASSDTVRTDHHSAIRKTYVWLLYSPESLNFGPETLSTSMPPGVMWPGH